MANVVICAVQRKDKCSKMARRSRRDTTEVSCVIKYLVFGFNIIFWVSGFDTLP